MGDVVLQKKITIEAKETADDVLARLEEETFDKIVISIPARSKICTEEELNKLRKLSNASGKEVSVESSNDNVLRMARNAGFASFRISEKRNKPILDIIPRNILRSSEKGRSDIPEFLRHPKDFSKNAISETSEKRSRPLRSGNKMTAYIIASCAVLLAAAVFLYFELPRATILITLKKTTVPFSETVFISSKAVSPAETKNGGILIPGELLVAQRNLDRTFPASGIQNVETKASGKLIVTNAYDSKPQPLVATTRFVSPGGKIFRLDQRTVIPGAKVSGGKIEPSKIEVSVTADKPGEEYNIEPSANWKIPGFMGTPKYSAFYAESVSPMTGGILGERPAPTDKDIEIAKQNVSNALKEATAGEIEILLSEKFVVLPGAEKFMVNGTEVRLSQDNPKNFSFFGEAEMRKIVFEAETLKNRITKQTTPGASFTVSDFSISYGDPSVNFSDGTMEVPISGNVVFEESIDKEKINNEILGMDEASLKRYVFALPGLEKATISLWPFWVKNVPDSDRKVNVVFK